MVWNSTAYTIHTLEETQRNNNRALLTSLSARQRDCLAALVKFAAYAPFCVKKKQVCAEADMNFVKGVIYLSICLENYFICLFFFYLFYLLIYLFTTTTPIGLVRCHTSGWY